MGNARPAALLLLLGLALLVCGAAGDRMVERAEVAPQPARVQTMVVVHGGRVVGVMQHVQLGRRFGPPELPPGAPDPAAECGQPQGGLSALLNWTACMVRCMRSRPAAAAPHTADQMEMVQMHLARAAALVGAAHGSQLPGATAPGFPGAAAEEQPASMPLARPGGMPLMQRWQWDVNVPVPAEQQAPADDDQLDSVTAQQLLGAEPVPATATATATAEPEPRSAPWWWPMGHARRPARGAAGGEEEAAEGCHCKHCGCHHHHGGKHHHHHHSHSHSDEEQPAPAQQLPMMMAALHDLAQQRAQQAADAQHAQRGHHGAPRHGNRDQLLPGVVTPAELIARERAKGAFGPWVELQAAQHPAGSGMSWSLWDASGRLNWGLAAFVALAVACAGVWSAMLAQCALYRSARANNNAAEVLAAQCYHRMASDEPEEGKGDLKPLLREGPVKGAIAAVHTKL